MYECKRMKNIDKLITAITHYAQKAGYSCINSQTEWSENMRKAYIGQALLKGTVNILDQQSESKVLDRLHSRRALYFVQWANKKMFDEGSNFQKIGVDDLIIEYDRLVSSP